MKKILQKVVTNEFIVYLCPLAPLPPPVCPLHHFVPAFPVPGIFPHPLFVGGPLACWADPGSNLVRCDKNLNTGRTQYSDDDN